MKRKYILTMLSILCLSTMLTACGEKEKPVEDVKENIEEVDTKENIESDKDIVELLGYIDDFKLEGNSLGIDDVEWVTEENRLKELGVESDMSNGFYIHNESNRIKILKKPDDIKIKVLDWVNDNGQSHIELSQEEFEKYLEDAPDYLYIIEVDGAEAISITECYTP